MGQARGPSLLIKPESLSGESVAASEMTTGQGVVTLAGLSINDLNKQASLSQSDKLRRFVEGQAAPWTYR